MARIIGITGPSGSGKSLFSKYLTDASIPCIDADSVYHSMLIPPSKCLDELEKVFGRGIIKNDGSLDRNALSSIVFNDTEKLTLLNDTVLPLVIERIRNMISELVLDGHKLIAVDAPTLIESGFHKECDAVIVITAPTSLREERIIERDHITAERAHARILSQKNDDFYISAATFVLRNDFDEPSFKEAAHKLITKLKGY